MPELHFGLHVSADEGLNTRLRLLVAVLRIRYVYLANAFKRTPDSSKWYGGTGLNVLHCSYLTRACVRICTRTQTRTYVRAIAE